MICYNFSKITTASQTHFGFTNMGSVCLVSELKSFRFGNFDLSHPVSWFCPKFQRYEARTPPDDITHWNINLSVTTTDFWFCAWVKVLPREESCTRSSKEQCSEAFFLSKLMNDFGYIDSYITFFFIVIRLFLIIGRRITWKYTENCQLILQLAEFFQLLMNSTKVLNSHQNSQK